MYKDPHFRCRAFAKSHATVGACSFVTGTVPQPMVETVAVKIVAAGRRDDVWRHVAQSIAI